MTNDVKLAANFTTRFNTIQEHFANMVSQLPEPYQELTLPIVVATAEVLAEE